MTNSVLRLAVKGEKTLQNPIFSQIARQNQKMICKRKENLMELKWRKTNR